MNHSLMIRLGLVGLVVAALALRSTTVQSDTVYFAGTPPTIAQVPLYIKDQVPPLNMLVMGKDHKIYYEAYNDASDLDGNGTLDVGYKPAEIDYYGYFNSNVCYVYEDANSGRFVPSAAAANKQCSGPTQWSGDFLNYLTTSRMDALRRVLYGGWRQVDTATDTVLQGAFFPQDAHSWGKEYKSFERDDYDISNYSPLSEPEDGKYHLFAVTTVTGNDATYATGYEAPLFRVMQNSDYRVWNWLSIEGPVAGNSCFTSANSRVDCIDGGTAWGLVPAGAFNNLRIRTWRRIAGGANPPDRPAMNQLFADNTNVGNRCGVGNVANIDTTGSDNNPFAGNNGCTNNDYLTQIDGELVISTAGDYRFAIDGDDAVELVIDGNFVVGWYGGHGNNRSDGGLDSHSATVHLTAGTHTIRFRHEEGGGGDNWGLFWQPPSGANSLTDYNVRVQVCPGGSLAALQDSTCKAYPEGSTDPDDNGKPTGILHDYGENQKMYFGLITGSQFNNLQGGVLRRNISNFADEINADDGTFKDGTGIANTLSRLRMIGGGYNGSTTNNLDSDTNWNWANDNGNCPSIGDRAIVNGECRMWGNPIAEMMFEGMRYFAGAEEATAAFGSGGASIGDAEETTMSLSQEAWKDPYGEGGYPYCAKPYETVISDINPSYDGDLPGSAFAAIAADPALSGFDASALGQEIWNAESNLGGSRSVFIGDVAGVTDNAPTAKMASSFGNIRGLAPEEPTKQGTYYSASVARYGYLNDLNAAEDDQKLGVYSIALASPLPRIEFPVGDNTVTLLPFAKTVSGTFGGGTRKPTNTIVDFYVEEIVNLPGGQFNAAVNGGRPSAIFRINYEDVEQGNDHDMDAIVKYTVEATEDNEVKISLESEYAAGSANQNIGYVISGTTEDGIYLEVRDTDSAQGSSVYALNTPTSPSTVWAGDCVGSTSTSPCNVGLTFNSTRTFTPGTTGAGLQLENPLWYAAKYGTDPTTADGDDSDNDPDNYFLVTNPLQLRTQLDEAFSGITDENTDVGVATISGARVGNSSFTLQPRFRRSRNGRNWTGNLTAVAVELNGELGDELWNAQSELPGPASRKVMTMKGGEGVLFNTANITLADLGIPTVAADVEEIYGTPYVADDFISYIKGDQANEGTVKGSGTTLRVREPISPEGEPADSTGVFGSIVNSEPVVVSPRANYGYGYYSDTMFYGYAGASGYLEDKKDRKTMAYVGANDGMLHAFDATTKPCAADTTKTCAEIGAGKELFAFIPGALLNRLGKLALPDSPYPDSTESFEHSYYVDGQMAVGDAKSDTGWKTLLIGSTGAGGRSVFALDVSNPDSFGSDNVLWERNAGADLDIGHVYGKPMLVPLENGEWGVLFGNGYGGNSSDPSLYILDAFTGDVIRKITAKDDNPAAAATNPLTDWICGVVGMFCARTADPFNGLGQITAIDDTGNGKVDTVYGGDLQGNLWEFDLTSGDENAWVVANEEKALFVAEIDGERQPITGGIRVAAGPGMGVMVYFGSGRYFVTGDNDVPDEPQVQSLYGVFDNGTAVEDGREDLVPQTIIDQTTADGFTTRQISASQVFYYGADPKRGWYIDLKVGAGDTSLGERFIATPLIRSGRVFFATFTPTENSCNPGGTNFQYGLDLLSGAGTLANVKILPNDTPACEGAQCGAVMINNGGAPIMSSGAAAISPLTQIDDTCDPATESCATFEQCQVVIYPGGFVLPRPCGRQSWRQLK